MYPTAFPSVPQCWLPARPLLPSVGRSTTRNITEHARVASGPSCLTNSTTLPSVCLAMKRRAMDVESLFLPILPEGKTKGKTEIQIRQSFCLQTCQISKFQSVSTQNFGTGGKLPKKSIGFRSSSVVQHVAQSGKHGKPGWVGDRSSSPSRCERFAAPRSCCCSAMPKSGPGFFETLDSNCVPTQSASHSFPARNREKMIDYFKSYPHNTKHTHLFLHTSSPVEFTAIVGEDWHLFSALSSSGLCF